ncbi:MAG TPA: ATP-binding protein [Blastocatellia bacterium]|nr:ATP-binding protein [Blastocatellia bacterium]
MKRAIKSSASAQGQRALKPHKPRASKTVSGAIEPPPFGEALPDKPPHPTLDHLLPFLEERITLRMPSDIKLLDGVLEYLNERLLRLGFVQPEDSELIIALDEAIVNAIKHGNKFDANKAVSITAELNAEGTRFIIADEGPGFDLCKVPDPTDPCRLLEPSGRGLYLISHIMDEVRFNDAGNQLTMFKRIRQCPRADVPESEK